jgi:hypothetical protein
MKVEELFEKDFSPRISVHLDDVKENDRNEIAGMLRGLMCSIEGWGVISGLTNDKFEYENPVILQFKSVENAHYFKECVEYYFDSEILERLKVKKRVYRT